MDRPAFVISSSHPVDAARFSRFPTTRWDWVEQLHGTCAEASLQALNLLCDGYWYPVFAHLRGLGHSPHESEDLTQGFFVKLLRTEVFARASQSKGRLRSYLLTCLQNFVREEHAAQNAQKRGHGASHVPLHLAWAEQRYENEPVDKHTPERVFNQRWWLLTLERAMHAVWLEYEARGDGRIYAELAGLLDSDRPPPGEYARIASELGIREQTLRVALTRLRQRVAKKVRDQVALLTGDNSLVDQELRALLSEG